MRRASHAHVPAACLMAVAPLAQVLDQPYDDHADHFFERVSHTHNALV
ncbi:hypothetical protein XHC_0249 [Xanthomonas hortorum pv. carotae str. M081]|nr:hypothetical protein XHC_0249 [Xanthomonas hortorum pv. carotae str. M081]